MIVISVEDAQQIAKLADRCLTAAVVAEHADDTDARQNANHAWCRLVDYIDDTIAEQPDNEAPRVGHRWWCAYPECDGICRYDTPTVRWSRHPGAHQIPPAATVTAVRGDDGDATVDVHLPRSARTIDGIELVPAEAINFGVRLIQMALLAGHNTPDAEKAPTSDSGAGRGVVRTEEP